MKKTKNIQLEIPTETVQTVPTLSQLVEKENVKLNNLMVLLNQPPPSVWLKEHPMVRGLQYLPIERVEYLLTRIFTKWWVEILEEKMMANSVIVRIRLFVINPLDQSEWHNDGVGAAPIQTDKGAGAMDWNKAKSDGVIKALPTAETYAIKDAADKFGKLFGKDIGRKTSINYNDLLKTETSEQQLKKLA